MRDVLLENLNLNLIPALRALLRECSVSRAAAVLGRSPSAISASLSQLREVLGDRLLVRVGGRLQLTAKAAELVGPVEELSEQLESLFRSRQFDPATSERKFTVAGSDLLINQIGPTLVQVMRREAPKMSLRFVDVGRGLTEGMAAREIDFALLPDFAIADLAPAPIKFKAFYRGESKALMSSDHPLARQSSVGKEDLGRYRHVAFKPDAVLLEGRRKLQRSGNATYQASDGYDLAVTVSHFLTIPRLLAGTDLVAVVPEAIAMLAIQTMAIVAVDLTYVTGKPHLGMAWSPVFDRDEAHIWFRKAAAEQAAEKFRSVQRYAAKLQRYLQPADKVTAKSLPALDK